MHTLDLRAIVGGDYQLLFDEAKPDRSCAGYWKYLPCAGGARIYAREIDLLLILSDPHEKTIQRLIDLGCVPVPGDSHRLTFRAELFPVVASIVRPNKRPKSSRPAPAPQPLAPATKKPSLLSRLNPFSKS